MREAFGSVWTIQIILIFLVLINAYLAFSVNYTKAFRIKNNIISIIETQEGFTEGAKTKTEAIMLDTGYNVSYSNIVVPGCESGGYKAIQNNAGGYCVKFNRTGTNSGYYSVKTYISIDIPVLGKILGAFPNTFAIKGETKTIYSSKVNESAAELESE